MLKKRSIITFGICFVLLAGLFFSNIILAQDGGSYDPWIDTNDDGIIDAIDLQALATIYSNSGTPINKTALLLELEARINSLNTTLLTEYYNMSECHVVFVDASGDVITGYLNVDSGTLCVDDVSDRVGIGTTTPLYKLDVGDTGDSYNYIRMRSAEFGGIIFYDGEVLNSGGILYDHINDALEFFTRHPSGFPIERMRITSDGDVGIGITDPTARLDVAGDIHGEALLADQIRLGHMDHDQTIYFYDDENPHGEHIEWNDALDRFLVSDDVDIRGDVTISGTMTVPTIPPTTRYYSIPGCAWLPTSSYEIGWYRSMLRLWTRQDYQTLWYAPVNLPHGAVVTEFRPWVYDNNATEDITVYLCRTMASDSYWDMATIESSGSSPAFVQYTDSSIDYAAVDNQNYAYLVVGALRSGDVDHRLGQVHITYTVTETLP